MQTTSDGRRRSGDSEGLGGLHQVLASVVAALVLLQAVLAGQSSRLFGTMGIGVHGTVANVIFVLVLADLAVAWRAGVSRPQLGVLAALFVAIVAQTGLGYAGRTSLGAAAWHIPTGVAIFGLAVTSLTLSLVHGPDRQAVEQRPAAPGRS